MDRKDKIQKAVHITACVTGLVSFVVSLLCLFSKAEASLAVYLILGLSSVVSILTYKIPK